MANQSDTDSAPSLSKTSPPKPLLKWIRRSSQVTPRNISDVPPKDLTNLYLIEDRSDQHIKIGVSSNPTRRLYELQSGNPVALEIINTIPCEREVERVFHHMFACLHVRGEWFRSGEWTMWLDDCIEDVRLNAGIQAVDSGSDYGQGASSAVLSTETAVSIALDVFARFPLPASRLGVGS